MDKDKFIKAIKLNKVIEEYKEHKAELEKSPMKHGGGLKFTYNSHYSEIPLKKELFGTDFFNKYMQALDNKIETLEKEFENYETRRMPRVQMVLCKNHQRFYRIYVLLFEIPPNRYEVWQTGKHQKKEEL